MKKTLLMFLLTSLLLVTACVPLDVPPVPSTQVQPSVADPGGNLDPNAYISVTYIDASGNVWFWKDNLEQRQLTFTMDAKEVCISSNGEWVAYLTTLGELWAIRTNGNENKKLVDRQYLNNLIPFGRHLTEIYRFEFVPEQDDLFFQVFAAGDVSGVDLFRVNVDQGLISRIYEPGQGGNGFYFSPNGEWVAITYPNQLILAGVNNGISRVLFPLPPLHGFSSSRGPQPVWSEDSSGFFILVPGTVEGDYSGQQGMYFVPVDEDPAAEPEIQFMSLPYIQAFVAPRGQQVAYLVDDDEVVNLHFVTRTDDQVADRVYISEAGVGFFGWNPDGERFVIWRGDRNKPLIATAGSVPVPLIQDPNLLLDSFQWVDDNCFLYTRLNPQEFGLYYLLPVDLPQGFIPNPNVRIASNVLPDRYDFTGQCQLP